MVSHVTVGVSTPFYDSDPDLVTMLNKVRFPMDFLNSTILEMSTKKLDGAAMATQFLRDHPEMWKQWVPADVASKVQANLGA
jgi:glycine betaine/proline transport system substrate-binding protein